MRLMIRCLTMAGLLGLLPVVASQAAQTPPAKVPAGSRMSTADLIYHVLVAEFAVRQDQLDTALAQYRIVVAASNDPQLAARATQLAAVADKPKLLLELARRWHALAPKDLEAEQALALALLRNDQTAEAVGYLDKVRAALAKHDQQDGFAALASMLGRLKDKSMVLQVLSDLSQRHPDSAYGDYFKALAAIAAQKPAVALASLGQALTHKPDWTQALLLQAQIRVQENQTDAAVTGLAAAVAKHPDDANLRLGYARLLVTANQLDNARQQFAEVAKRHPHNAEALFALGVLAAEAKQYDQAKDYLQRVLKLGQRVAESDFELGRIAELQDDYQAAQHWYEQVPDDSDRWLTAQARAAVMDAKLGHFARMHQRFDELRHDNPDEAVSLYTTESDALGDAGRPLDALNTLSAGLAQYPGNHDLLYSHALAAVKLDKIAIAEKDLRQIIKDDPNNGQALNALGYTLADRTKRYQEALGLIERAYKLLPNDAAVIDSMGWVQYRLGHDQEALKYLREANAKTDEPEITMHLVKVLLALGQHKEARKIWEKAYKAHPDSTFLQQLKANFTP